VASPTAMGLRSHSDSMAIQRIIDAAGAVDSARHSATTQTVADTERELREVVQAADRGVSWQSIGDALGIRRGAAYKRFHRRLIESVRRMKMSATSPWVAGSTHEAHSPSGASADQVSAGEV
jgi:hypothetical protein